MTTAQSLEASLLRNNLQIWKLLFACYLSTSDHQKLGFFYFKYGVNSAWETLIGNASALV